MSEPRRRRIDEIGDESRRRILDAAEALFAERGFDRTSFVDIAARSGISRGSIPWHFTSKDGLIIAVVERALDRHMDPQQYTTPPTLSDVLADYASWARDANSALLFTVLTEAMASTGLVHAPYREFLRERREAIEQWVRARRPHDADPATSAVRERAFAASIQGAVLGVHLQSLIDPDAVDLGASLDDVARLFETNIDDVWRADPASA